MLQDSKGDHHLFQVLQSNDVIGDGDWDGHARLSGDEGLLEADGRDGLSYGTGVRVDRL